MKRLLTSMARAGAIAACVLVAGHAMAAAPGVAPARVGQAWIAASDSTLAKMRGGFDLGGGLMVSFGFMRSIAINGSQLVNSTFNIPNLSSITPQQAAAIGQHLGVAIVQNGPGNKVGSVTSPGSSHAETVTASSSGSVTVSAGSGSSGGASASKAGGMITINTGPVGGAAPHVAAPNTANVSTLPTGNAALGTIVQNTLNNQTIQTNTVIDVSTNGLSIWRGLNLLNTLSSALANLPR